MRFPFFGKREAVLDRCVSPVVEQLEERRLFALSYSTFQDADGHWNLLVKSNNSSSTRNETINVTENLETGKTTISGTSIATKVLNDPDPSDGVLGFEVIRFDMRDGHDTVNLNLVGNYYENARSYDFDMGEGDDDINFNGANADVLWGTSINIRFDGDGGNDDINMALGDFYASELSVTGYGDGESDDFVYVLGDIDSISMVNSQDLLESDWSGSTIDIDTELSSGSLDTVTTILGDVGYGADVTYDIKGGSGNDRMGMIFNGFVDGKLHVNVSLDSGNDVLDVQLNEDFGLGGLFLQPPDAATAGLISEGYSDAEARFNLNGNDGNDTITVRAGEKDQRIEASSLLDAGNVFVAPGALLDVRIMGGNNDDKLNVDFSTEAGLSLQGDFKLRVDGQAGNDQTVVRLFLSECSSGNVDGQELGGSGNDKVYLYLYDYSQIVNSTVTTSLISSGVSYGPTGYFLQDGYSNTDKGYTQFNGETLGAGQTAGTPINRRSIETILLTDPLPLPV